MHGLIQGVLFLEKLVGPPGFPGLDRLGQSFQVAAGAKTPLARARKQNKTNACFLSGDVKGRLEQTDHLQIEAVDGLRPVEGYHQHLP